MVTKAGGITTTECLAAGVPMALLRPVPGQEMANARALQREGAAVITGSTDHLLATVRGLLDDDGELAALSAAARRPYRPAAQTIVDAIQRRLALGGGAESPAHP
jgi:processive 1,2-diacylglycerol beta-glucosyltransferase